MEWAVDQTVFFLHVWKNSLGTGLISQYGTTPCYLKENLALVTEGAMQQNCQTTYKLLETNLAILQWGEEKGDGVQQNEGDHMLFTTKYRWHK